MAQSTEAISEHSGARATAAGAFTDSDDDRLDIRVALVLYGGVSLAIYENGVTRCFYELVKRRGIFDLLLKLRDAKAQVDVIAGTSAGGINGLLLAATLESGADFTDSENLWRSLGDLGALLRDVREADDAPSLLKGESYYQDQLIEAFRKYCTPLREGYEYPNELDVFITTTDLDGQLRANWDALGDHIFDKEHRVVFQLQHRPDAKALGYTRHNTRKKSAVKAAEQGTILGCIARMTSSFPAAFPPFRLKDLDVAHGAHKEAVQTALETSAQTRIEELALRSFADGGLLDNKPFGPVLEAIFHHTPTGLVERRLFYVEPDPEPKPGAPKPDAHTPLEVAGASLSTIPSHETIWGDLRNLERHNAQVEWLAELKDRWIATVEDDKMKAQVTGAFDDPEAPWTVPYWNTRAQSLVRSLFLASDATTPSAEDEIANPEHKQLARMLGGVLGEWTKPPVWQEGDPRTRDGAPRGPFLNSFDADFQLRRSFHVLYRLSRILQGTTNDDTRRRCRAAMRLIGRIIKAQRIVRDRMVDLRLETLRQLDEVATDETSRETRYAYRAGYVVNLYRLFLDVHAEHWAGWLSYCRMPVDEIRAFDSDWRQFLSPGDLLAADEAASLHAKNPRPFARDALRRAGFTAEVETVLTTEILSVRWTILDELEQALRGVVDAWCAGSSDLEPLRATLDRFLFIDVVAFPLEFSGGMYSLDKISYVRISPQDAQTGLAEGNPKCKVAGDELFHFSAFLRKDWRSNDILQGRLDGICQIVHSLLAPTASTVCQVRRVCGEMTPLFRAALFDESERTPHGLRCLRESWLALSQSWSALVESLQGTDLPDPGDGQPFELPVELRTRWKAFADCLIRVGQDDAFLGSYPGILTDHYYQEMAFGEPPDDEADDRSATEKGARPEPTSETMLLGQAADLAGRDLARQEVEVRWGKFKAMHLGGDCNGGEQASGRDSEFSRAVPPHISGEYVTHAYLLLWGMMRTSLGKVGQAVLDKKTVRIALRHPVAFLNALFFLMRRQYITALASIATTAGVILGVAGAAYMLRDKGGLWLFVGAVAVLFLFMSLVAWAVPRMRRQKLALALLPVGFLLLLGVGAWIALNEGVLRTWWSRLAAFVVNGDGPLGFAIGFAVAAIAWAIVTLVRKLRG